MPDPLAPRGVPDAEACHLVRGDLLTGKNGAGPQHRIHGAITRKGRNEKLCMPQQGLLLANDVGHGKTSPGCVGGEKTIVFGAF